MSSSPSVNTVLADAKWNYSDTVSVERSPVALTLNHPKNYFGVLLATAMSDDSALRTQIQRYLVNLPDRALAGAVALGLVSVHCPHTQSSPCSSCSCSSHESGHSISQTALGAQLISQVRSHSTVRRELTRFGDLRGSSQRFVTALPDYWQSLIRTTLTSFHLAGDIATLLESTGPVTLAELGTIVERTNHPFGISLFSQPTDLDYTPPEPSDRTQSQQTCSHSSPSEPSVTTHPSSQTSSHQNAPPAPSSSQDSPPHSLQSLSTSTPFTRPDIYRGQTVYQLKTLLYHCGLLTERGADTSALVPTQDVWQLEPQYLTTPSLRGDH
jgi:hypothetical protein